MQSWLLTTTKWAICAYLTISLLNVQHFSFLIRVLSFVMMGLVSLWRNCIRLFFLSLIRCASEHTGQWSAENTKQPNNLKKETSYEQQHALILHNQKFNNMHTQAQIPLRWASDRVLLLSLVVIAVLIAAAIFECIACYTDIWCVLPLPNNWKFRFIWKVLQNKKTFV